MELPPYPEIECGPEQLLRAAEHGDEGAVKLLLERQDIDPNTADTKYGRTALFWAVEQGHEEVVKLLLQRDDIDPNTSDQGSERSENGLVWTGQSSHSQVWS